jgi:sulfoxide reductase heme-binding subunit YedZ
MLAAWLKRHYRFVWWMIFLLACLPGAELAYGYTQGELGINALETLIRTPGRWALVFLIITLSMTPLRRGLSRLARQLHSSYGKRLADWNWIIRLRRMLGLWCFAYALAHGWLFLHFDPGYDWLVVMEEIREKPYLLAGAFGLLLLFPLAATSTNGMMRRLGRNWRRLHRLTYAVAVLGVVHYWWLVKPGFADPWPYTLALTALLGYRLLAARGVLIPRPSDDGMEIAETGPGPSMTERRRRPMLDRI